MKILDFELRNKITRDTADGNKDPEKADSSKYPIETYQGLEEATAERIKRFEDETKAMLMRNSRSDLTPATPEMGRTTSGTFTLNINIAANSNRHLYFNIIKVTILSFFRRCKKVTFYLNVLGFFYRRCRKWACNVKV